MENLPSQSISHEFGDPSDVIGLVRSIWRDILDFEPDDDIGFFDCGGDSHRLFVLVEHLSKAGGVRLKTLDVIRADTVSGQAELLARMRRARPEESTHGS
ncbi:phosphopantetheine-binding protein [Streptomyces sp. NPDC089799]|uniref:phosphopantetheine-binding protein n=1 Tax=Streptomyces sp. NPDC089799 TaxID=3155066 RepID=UPI003412BDF5